MPVYLITCHDYHYDTKKFFLLYYGEEMQSLFTSSYLKAWEYFDYCSETKDVLFV